MAKFSVKSVASNATFKNVVRTLRLLGFSLAAATAMATQAMAQVNVGTNGAANTIDYGGQELTCANTDQGANTQSIGNRPIPGGFDPATGNNCNTYNTNNATGGNVGDLTTAANQYLTSNPTASVGDVASHLSARFNVSPQISNDIAATAKQNQQQHQAQQAQAEASNYVEANPQATSGDVAAHLNSKNFNSLDPTMINRIATDAVATGGNVEGSGNSQVDANNDGNVFDASDNSSSTYRNQTTIFNPPALPPAVPGSAGRTFRVVTPSGEVLLQENAVVTQRGINASLLINGSGGNFQMMNPVIVGEENITDLGDTPVRAFDAIIGTIQPVQPVRAVSESEAGSRSGSEARVDVTINGVSQPPVIRRGNR